MYFEEHAAKLLLAAAGIATPPGELATSAKEAEAAAARIGACAIKAQVPVGKRGKAGGIKLAGNPAEAGTAAAEILAMEIGGHKVATVLVEAQVPIAAEYYAAVLNDPETKGPIILFSAAGGMEIEDLAATRPETLLRLPVDVRHSPAGGTIEAGLAGLGLAAEHRRAVAKVLVMLYAAYREHDAELLEINPLALTGDGRLVALDCKFVLDDSALPRRAELAERGTPESLTGLEAEGRALGLRFIELDGSVGVLANGAGLTMTTIDAVRHYGGQPVNFLKIGGDAYVKAAPALELVLANPKVKSLLINFCGAVARTDVMTGGVLDAWDQLKPELPVFFSIHGTGEEEAVAMLRARLGLEPFDLMDDAVKAAVEAAGEAAREAAGEAAK